MRWAHPTATGTDLLFRGWALALVLGALLGTGACTKQDGERPGATPNAEPIRAAFDSKVEVRDQQVRVSYRLTNNEAGELVVLNRVYQTQDGRWQTKPAFVYAVGRDGGRVEISKRALPRPENSKINLYRSPTIGGIVLRPGETVTEQFALQLPLQRFHPYGNDVGHGMVALPDPITELVFCLGAARGSLVTDFRSPAPTTPVDGAAPEFEELTEIPHAGQVLNGQHLFCSDPVRMP